MQQCPVQQLQHCRHAQPEPEEASGEERLLVRKPEAGDHRHRLGLVVGDVVVDGLAADGLEAKPRQRGKVSTESNLGRSATKATTTATTATAATAATATTAAAAATVKRFFHFPFYPLSSCQTFLASHYRT